MNYLEEQTDGEAMINSIKNGDQPSPRVTQVSITGTSSNEQPPLKDKSINKTAKDLWDALARYMLGSEYEWKQYATMMRQNKNLMDINIDALCNILKQNQGDVNDATGLKKKTVVVTSEIPNVDMLVKLKKHCITDLDDNGADVAIHLESIRAISERFVNSAYGFFLGKRVAYAVVANYFSSEDGLDAMLEKCLWFIRIKPFILKSGIRMTAFSDDGLSVIASKQGTPLMLDSYTFDMCNQSWGRPSYARAMIDLRADEELKDSIMVDMTKLVGEGFNMCTVRVEDE
nr:hypothetical protein [Tanacetum cinerariifolium]